MTKSASHIDDPLWKSIIEDACGDFLRFFYPDIEKHVDFTKPFTFLDKEFESLFPPEPRNLGVRFVDKLIKLFRIGGEQQYFLCHIEVQSNKGKGDLAERMFTYFYRIFDKYKVPITAIAILVDPNHSYQPEIYKQEFLGTSLCYKFNSYKVIKQSEKNLRANPNPFSVVMLTALKALKNKHLDDTQLMNMKLDLYKEMSYRKMNTQTRKGIYNFLLHYVNFNEHEMLKKLEQTIKKITGRSTSMGTEEYLLEKAKIKGLEQGIEQGRQQGEEAEKWKIAGKLKAMGFDLVKIAEITGLTTTQIQKL